MLASFNPRFGRELDRAISRKGRGITLAIERLAFSRLMIEDGKLFVIDRSRKKPAFPEMDKQLSILLELERHSEALSKTLNAKTELRDLL